ncbi:sulfite exporter TauE/SafE family protein [Oxalobacteraceae bacterium OM1]|nr:sulfite exporter TauE/SafE family protein [Oxalobacteraceae bacterium OM1]
MHEFLSSTVLLAAPIFVLAGFVKGVIGMGLPTVAIGLLGAVMPPAQAAAMLVVPSLVTNVWQLLTGPRFLPLLRRLWTMLLGFCAGTWMAAGTLTGNASGRAGMLLGLALMLYAVFGLVGKRFHVSARAEPWLSPVIGVATGIVAGSTGVFVIPAVPYLQALSLERDELVQALGLSFTVSTIALGLVLAFDGTLLASTAVVSFAALLPALAGMFAGQWLRGRIPVHTFRLCFFGGLLLLGAHLAIHGWLH